MAFYDHVPRSRAEAKGALGVILWAVFGNDDDGIFWPAIQPGWPPKAVRTAGSLFWRWWLRNKLHNLFFHTRLFRRVVSPVYVLGRSDPPSLERHKPVVLRFRPFFLKLGYAFIGNRADTPIPGAWGGKFDHLPGSGGKFDLGVKDIT